MNILYVGAYFQGGGAEKVMRQLYYGVKSGEVHTYALVGRWQPDIPEDVTVVYSSFLERLVTLVQGKCFQNTLVIAPKFQREIIRCIRQNQIDIVHFHNIHGMYMNISSLKTIKQHCRNVVITMHDMWLLTGGCPHAFSCRRWENGCKKCPGNAAVRSFSLSHALWKQKKRALTESGIQFVTPSDWLLQECRRGLLKTEQIRRIYNGISLTTFRGMDKERLREKYGFPKNKKLLLFVANGTNNVYKGFSYLLEALQLLAKKEEYALMVVGNKNHSTIETEIEMHDMGQIKDQKMLAELYASADLFLIPSVAETLSFVAMEAMACGTPCVAFRTGGIPEVIGDAGWIVEEKSAKALAATIEKAIRPENRDEYNCKAGECRDRVEQNFDEQKMLQQYLNFYHEMMNREALKQ